MDRSIEAIESALGTEHQPHWALARGWKRKRMSRGSGRFKPDASASPADEPDASASPADEPDASASPADEPDADASRWELNISRIGR